MNKLQIIMASLLICTVLFLAGCSNQPNNGQVIPNTNNSPPILGTEQNASNNSIPTQNESPKTIEQQVPPPSIGYDNLSAPKVSVNSIEVFGSRFGSKYLFNRIQVNITSDMPINWPSMQIYEGNQYNNNTYNYNQNLSCDNVIGLLTHRNDGFLMTNGTTQTTICLSPLYDIHPSETLMFKGVYNGTIVIDETTQIPTVVANTYLRLK